ncbi:MAG: hypothetical protein HQM16_06985, partial [Deltaproteobacteria bacterium]|nr:hypothetical protein [Deltaproteobacteria bacterium]
MQCYKLTTLGALLCAAFLSLPGCHNQKNKTEIGPQKKNTQGQHDRLLQYYPTEALTGEIITLKPIEGHHFNLEAPQKCGNEDPIVMAGGSLSCRFNVPGTMQIVTAICDDAVTFCQLDRLSVKVMNQQDIKNKGPQDNTVMP